MSIEAPVAPHLVTVRDWAGIALREATVLAGTPEGAAKLAESKRYSAIAETLAALVAERDAAVADAKRLKQAVEDAFQEGYWSRHTYNDIEVSDFDEQWRNSSARAATDSARAQQKRD
jgi:uncharacterized protein YqfA (UPF0365 family)